MITDADVVTYAAAAQWLPLDVRETIEVTTPCSPALPGGHPWIEEGFKTEDVWGTVSWVKWWECSACGVTARRDPGMIRRGL